MIYAAAYCRVSTDKDDQTNSFESQKRYFEEYINRKPDLELVEIYADEGLTGTSTKKRKAFNKMIADAHIGRFNLILTKEVSRFARNTVDTLQYTRDLRKIGVGVQFMLDNINTLDPDGELRLSIMASIAQEESRKTSERVKWGQRRQMERGVVFGGNCLGFDVRDGKLFINEYGARLVRLIFHKFVNENKGTCTIARELRESGYKTAKGNTTWKNSTILKTLRNEKYCGDLIQKKTITPDFLTHEKKYNHGEEDMIIIPNHHEPIISRTMWNAAQAMLAEKAPSDEIKKKHSNRYPLSGKIECGICGSHFVSRTKKRQSGSLYKAWRCYNAAQYGFKKTDNTGNNIGCDVHCQIMDEDFMEIIRAVVKNINTSKDMLIKELCEALSDALKQTSEVEYDTGAINKKLALISMNSEKILDLYLDEIISKEEYRKRKELCENEIKELTRRLSEAEKISPDISSHISTIKKYMQAVLDGTKQDESFYKFIIEKIVVFSREEMDVYLNALPFRLSIIIKSALDEN